MSSGSPRGDGLARSLGAGDAVTLGLSSMLGAGVFAAVGPAAAVAGSALLYGLLVAGIVAYCNATSSAELAALYPSSGGTYVYGRERLGPGWGFMAGWAFVAGKVASLAAIALTFGQYVAPGLARPLAVGAVVVVTGVNYRGITKTARTARVLLVLVLASLLTVVAGCLFGGEASVGNLTSEFSGASLRGVLEAAALLFFAFAGYARIATLGDEVVDPETTIPRAIPMALGIALLVYTLVAVSALSAIGADGVADSSAPLAAAVGAGGLSWLAPVARIGAAVASLGVLLSLLAGVSRTLFAMAGNREMPTALAAVHPRWRVPHRAELAIAGIVIVLTSTVDLRSAIGFSSFCVLVYYAITNAAAWTLPKEDLLWPRLLAGAGLVGSLALALSLAAVSVAIGVVVLVAGALVYLVVRRLDGQRF